MTLDGALAALLFAGGAYRRSEEWTAKDVKTLARDFCAAVMQERFDTTLVWSSTAAWSSWFYDVAWDSTWIIFYPPARRVWILMVTDTD